jgi:hypothetical protein
MSGIFRGIGMVLGVFIESPFLALIPAAIFALVFARCRKYVALAAALAWAAYLPYEYAMKLRILCSGECNIRVDLLLLYPFLLVLSALAVYALVRSSRGLTRA